MVGPGQVSSDSPGLYFVSASATTGLANGVPAIHLCVRTCGCRMPLFIVTALYCLTTGKAEVAFCTGSHHAGRAPYEGEDSFHGNAAEPIEVEAGDVLLYRSDLWRQVVPLDDSSKTRHALRVHYSQPHIGHRFHPFVGQEGGATDDRYSSWRLIITVFHVSSHLTAEATGSPRAMKAARARASHLPFVRGPRFPVQPPNC